MKQLEPSHLNGNCECGTFSFKINKAPRARFVCHCLFCQDFTGEAFSDVSVVLGYQIQMIGTADLIHKKYRLPPNLNRTLCSKCGKPAMESMGVGPLKLVFVPSKNFVEPNMLLPARMHVFYNRRTTDIADELPKYSHYWPSQFAITKTILGF